ncbi:hypothetical protein FE840_020640 (plasmid) [Peteryoungia desertarenae]|uniref:Uncharacterized protein n=1 Tax=Peteryoungia desertarenae TaxID=1813451 RepID=A0ABX6QTY9_9HYPH|nr:hypothetical protein [Peteryoungia desertarenae]QLF72048.1 hypothetical protein FE840_020640 [Peteryoungia desertarenae]
MNIITEDTFIEQFQPQVNHHSPSARCCLFQAFGADLKAVTAVKPAHVWTLIEADGAMYLVSGLRFSNQRAYVLTSQPVPLGEEYSVILGGVD